MEQSAFTRWKRLMRYLAPYRKWAILAFIGVISANGLAIAIPSILRDVIDIGIERNDSDFMLQAGLLVIGLGILRGFAGFLTRFFGERLSHYVAYDIRNEMYDKVQSLAFSYHDNAQVGTIITRAISDVDEVQRYFAFGLIDGLNTLLLFLGVATVMLFTSPILALAALLPMIPLAIYSYRFVIAVDPRWKKIMERVQVLSNHLQENAMGAEVVRVFAREKYEIEKFEEQNEKLYYEQTDLIYQWAGYLPTSAFIAASSTAIVLLVGGWFVREGIGGVTVGLVVSFNAYVLLLVQPLRFIGFVILLTTQALRSSERVFEVLDAEETIDSKKTAQSMPTIEGHVQFKDVTFAYEGTKLPALNNISFEAQAGQVIGIIGMTGSGKSSLVSLIPRFYDVTEGKVLIDGHDVRDVSLHSLRSQIGIVLQDSLLFSATIGENIAYGNPKASQEQIIEAAKAADAHNFITEFPAGYNTLVGERGVTLSGGQRQRVAIARALLIDPRVLILDDSTSSVDTKTERMIQEALERLLHNRTTFIIAQRLSSVLGADQIFVMKDGTIVERGTHDELVALGGHYTQIYDLQMAEQEKFRIETIAERKRARQDMDDKRSTKELPILVENMARKGK